MESLNEDQIIGKWKELKGKAQAKWGELTDDELDQLEGRSEELQGLVQQKYGKTKEEAKKEVEEWKQALSA